MLTIRHSLEYTVCTLGDHLGGLLATQLVVRVCPSSLLISLTLPLPFDVHVCSQPYPLTL